MNLRTFFKSLLCTPALTLPLPSIPKSRVYLKQCPVNEVIGLCMEWDGKQHGMDDNPFPGHDWMVSAELGAPAYWKGQLLENRRMNKFIIIPLGVKTLTENDQQLICLQPVRLGRNEAYYKETGYELYDWDHEHYDLTQGRFYRA